MVPLLVTMLMMAPTGGSVGEVRSVMLRDPQQGPTPVTDKYIVSRGPAVCSTPEDLRRAREESIKGYEPECIVPRKADTEQPQR